MCLRDLSSLKIDFILPVNYKISKRFTTDFHKLDHHLGLSINKHQSETVYMSTCGHHHVFIQPNPRVTYSIQNTQISLSACLCKSEMVTGGLSGLFEYSEI